MNLTKSIDSEVQIAITQLVVKGPHGALLLAYFNSPFQSPFITVHPL